MGRIVSGDSVGGGGCVGGAGGSVGSGASDGSCGCYCRIAID